MISNPLNRAETPCQDAPDVQEELSPGLKMLKQYPLLPAFASQYAITEELGAGGFGFVVGAIHRPSNTKVAVKFLFKNKIPRSQLVVDAVMGCIPRETYILDKVNHPGIVKFLDLFQDQCFYYMVMELHGDPWAAYPSTRKCRDLFESIEKAGTFNELQTAHILYQLLNILMYLQSVNVYHRDIKDENIVIDSKLTIKLVDFGCAVVTPTRRACTFQHFFGTASYASPRDLEG
ncbi:hypothetical protein DSO57_1031042 [Entomophthora muscae]|uniref:Uncharacterized protein n=1 Tax=Entomophthora muscae TaxID=34485 RepID=A0ACC2TMP2_9FUNG|nr:hypothetical protein DSO57_1031042 [Entomophthora muscae]